VALGSKVPPVTRPRMYPPELPFTPALTSRRCLPFGLHAPGLWPAFVRNVPRSFRVSVYEPSLLRPPLERALLVSTAQRLLHEPWSSVTTSYVPILAVMALPLPVARSRRGRRGHARARPQQCRDDPALRHFSDAS
jgi:hypothetical protein